MHWIDTGDIYAHILITITDGGIGLIAGTHMVDVLRKIVLGNLKILGLETDVPTLLQALIRLRGTTAPDLHGVREPVLVLLQVGIDESVTGTQQHDQHEDTPRHSKACERRAELVPPCRLPYFYKNISHMITSSFR